MRARTISIRPSPGINETQGDPRDDATALAAPPVRPQQRYGVAW